MKFVCYSDWGQLPNSADALFARAANENVFFSRPWFECLTTVSVDTENSLALACVVAGDKVLALLPLLKTAAKTWYSLKHRYTPHYSLLLADDDQPQVLTCLAEGLSQLPLQGLILEPVADDDAKLNGLRSALETAGFHCEHLFRHYNWIYRVQGQSSADYLASRPAHLLNTITRKQRKLEREHGYEIRLFTGTDAPQAMADYYTVYTASWKANEQNKELVDSLVTRFSMRGWTRLAVLYIQGQPAAAQLWFVHHRKASIFRLAYDEAWKPFSPGSILTCFLMEHMLDKEQVEEIDFLTGNEAYKQEWMSERRTRYALCCVKHAKPRGKFARLVAALRRSTSTS